MKQLLILAACLLPVLGRSQSHNFVRTTKYKVPTQISIPSPLPNQAIQNITYNDGLGRPIQQTVAAQSASGKSIITPIEYDESGRRSKEYLSYPSQSSGLNFEPNALTDIVNYSEYQGRIPYSQKLFEKSPIGRVLKQAAPGIEWSMDTGKEIKKDYGANTTSDGVKLYRATSILNIATGAYDVSFTSSTYPEGQLWKDIIKDENWTSGFNNSSETYKDKHGKLILKRRYENGEKYDTYYVYDQYDNLSYVFPPMASNPSTQLNDFCYQYKYDHRNRLIEKKLPGRQWEYMVYDKLDRLIATGPALSPFDGNTSGWLITKYDIQGRIAYTGWYSNTGTRKSIQDQANAFTNLWEQRRSAVLLDNISIAYTNTAFPTSNMKLLTVNYYDDYSFPNAPSSFPAIEGQTVYYNATIKPKGILTGKWVRLLEGTSSTQGELTYTLYDYKSRPIGIRTLNYLGGYTYVDNKLDFLGNTMYTITRHKRKPSSQEVKITERFTYTDQNRLLKHTHQIGNAQEELLNYNIYDELGRLVTKKVGGNNASGNTFLQKVDFSYNFRGWLTGINSIDHFDTDDGGTDLFAMTLGYNDVSKSPDPVKTTPLFNGNISYSTWVSKSDSRKRSYIYQYDALNRLRNATYYKDGRNSRSYDESIAYDKNGNITHLDRYGDLDYDSFAIQIDELDYTYKGNLLRSVSDKTRHPVGFTDGTEMADEYKYDGNGNMISDENKGIKSITYNHMNLPIEIVFGTEKINYLYDAAGKKIRKTVSTATAVIETEYLSGFQYISGNLDFFPTAEGYVKWLDDQFYGYVYNFKDQLGNIRMSYAMDPKEGRLIILAENHYYPYGLKHEKYNSDRYDYVKNAQGEEYPVGILPVEPTKRSSYQYKFNDQEWQDELGLNMYDMDLRDYDPAIAKWTGIDPVIHYNQSPYNAFDGNPVFWSDPSGAKAQPIYGGWAFTGKDIPGIMAAILSFLDTGSGTYIVEDASPYASGPKGEYISADAAALDFAMQYNAVSIINRVELGSAIYSSGNGKSKYFSYTTPTGTVGKGNSYAVQFGINDIPSGGMLEGFVHTHANYTSGSNKFDSGDHWPAKRSGGIQFGNNFLRVPVYLVTPSGELRVSDAWNPNGPKQRPDYINIGNNLIPSDPKSPGRLNPNVNLNFTPIVPPTIIGTDGYPIVIDYTY